MKGFLAGIPWMTLFRFSLAIFKLLPLRIHLNQQGYRVWDK